MAVNLSTVPFALFILFIHGVRLIPAALTGLTPCSWNLLAGFECTSAF